MIKLPLYDLFIDNESDDEIVVSFVKNPAVGYRWQIFAETKKRLFSVDEEKRLVTGILIAANMPIYRRDERGEYFVRIPKETVEAIVLKMAKKGFGFSVNLEHTIPTKDAYLVELFMIDRNKGILPNNFGSVTDGSLVGTYKITNEKIWQKVKDGEFEGFSIEGNFLHKISGTTDKILADRIVSIIRNI